MACGQAEEPWFRFVSFLQCLITSVPIYLDTTNCIAVGSRPAAMLLHNAACVRLCGCCFVRFLIALACLLYYSSKYVLQLFCLLQSTAVAAASCRSAACYLPYSTYQVPGTWYVYVLRF